MKIISKRGDGDFVSLAEAMTWAGEQPAGPLTFLLRMDAYDEALIIERDHVRLVGEAQKRTILRTACEPCISGKNVSVENLTVSIKKDENSEPTEVVYDDGTAKRACAVSYFIGDERLNEWMQYVPKDVQTEVCIQPGASTKSIVASKWLGFVELCLRPGDKLLIAVGLHDADAGIDVHTNPRTTMQRYLSMMIDAARMQKAEPVLLLSDAVDGEYRAAMMDHAALWGVRTVDLSEPQNLLSCL